MTRADELLRRHPLVARLRPEQLDRFLSVGQLVSCHTGETIVDEGTLGDSLYLVLGGSVTVEKGAHRLAELGPGEFFGEMSLVEPAARSATVRALSPVHLFRLPHFALQRLLDEDAVVCSQVLIMVVQALSERLRRANALIGDVGHLADWLGRSFV